MCFRVPRARALRGKRARAYGACVWSRARVGSTVVVQRCEHGERLAARFALVWFLASMSAFVPLERNSFRKAPVASRARKLPFAVRQEVTVGGSAVRKVLAADGARPFAHSVPH